MWRVTTSNPFFFRTNKHLICKGKLGTKLNIPPLFFSFSRSCFFNSSMSFFSLAFSTISFFSSLTLAWTTATRKKCCYCSAPEPNAPVPQEIFKHGFFSSTIILLTEIIQMNIVCCFIVTENVACCEQYTFLAFYGMLLYRTVFNGWSSTMQSCHRNRDIFSLICKQYWSG